VTTNKRRPKTRNNREHEPGSKTASLTPGQTARARSELARQHGALFHFRNEFYWRQWALAVLFLDEETSADDGVPTGFERRSWECITFHIQDGTVRLDIDREAAEGRGLTVPDDLEFQQLPTTWKARHAAAFALFAQRVVDLTQMKIVDDYGLNLLWWFPTARFEALCATDRQRLAAKQNAKNKRERNVELFKEWKSLVSEGLAEMKSERAAKADAYKRLAKGENVRVERAREIIREARASLVAKGF
jgi:hypothetical protein